MIKNSVNKLKRARVIWLILNGTLMILNYLTHSIIHYDLFRLKYVFQFNNEFQKGLALTIFIGIPLVGFLFGLLISLFPFRKLTYLMKCVTVALLSAALLQFIYLSLGLLGQIV